MDNCLIITDSKVSVEWYAEDEDCFNICIKHSLELEYEYTFPAHMEGVTHNQVQFTAAYMDRRISEGLLREIRQNGALHEAVADWLDEHREEIEQAEEDARQESQAERFSLG